jgi:hypothetical protein
MGIALSGLIRQISPGYLLRVSPPDTYHSDEKLSLTRDIREIPLVIRKVIDQD